MKDTYMIDQLKKLTSICSPTGMTKFVTDYLMQEIKNLGFAPVQTNKGTVMCTVCADKGHHLLLSAHVDTLGAMVRSVKSNGCLRYTQIGGYNNNAIENENVIIYTRSSKTYTGTVQSIHASSHVWGDNSGEKREDNALEIVIDEETWSKEDTLKLGIQAGDFIAFDPRTVVTESGFIKSRHLDDKASSAVLLSLLKDIKEGTITPTRKLTFVFTVYEEVGHGASPLYKLDDIEDMLAVDMGCVGDDLTCKETMVSICAKDSAGPFDYDFTNELIDYAKQAHLDYAVDIYPRYSSDAATAIKAGLDVRFALCGQGVFASHGYERTHIKGMENTKKLCACVLQKTF